MIDRCCQSMGYHQRAAVRRKFAPARRQQLRTIGPVVWLLPLCLLTGCRGEHRPISVVPTTPVVDRLPADAVRIDAHPAALGETAGGPNSAASLADVERVLAELDQAAPLDPAQRQQWRDDLAQTDPKLWPMLVQSYRASAGYRARQANAGVLAGAAPGAPSTGSGLPPSPGNVPPLAAEGPIPPDPAVAQQAALAVLASGFGQPPVAAHAHPIIPAAYQAGGLPTPAASPPGSHSATVPAPAAAAVAPMMQDPAGDGALVSTIAQLESQAAGAPTGDPTPHVYLRMAYLSAGRRDDALTPIPGLPPDEQQFWAHQLLALATYLDTARQPSLGQRAAEARQHLHEASHRLGESATLVVRNLAFCTEVSSYGVYARFDRDEFTSGQQVLLYAELDNFKSRSTPQGYHTSIGGSYQILDRQGRRIAHEDLPELEEYCQNERRDYFVRYFLTLPEPLYAGSYVLQLTLEDHLAKKVGQATIEFQAR